MPRIDTEPRYPTPLSSTGEGEDLQNLRISDRERAMVFMPGWTLFPKTNEEKEADRKKKEEKRQKKAAEKAAKKKHRKDRAKRLKQEQKQRLQSGDGSDRLLRNIDEEIVRLEADE